MCRTGLEVLDVYPFTRSYPEGTGGPEVAYYKEHDIVHFKFHVMKTIDLFIEDYFRGQVVLPISLRNYVFSWTRAIFNWVLKVIHDWIGFALLCCLIGLENSRHPLSQSDVN